MRVNRLVAEIEEPVRVMMPQVTRTIKAADEMTTLLQGPVRVAAPQIERIVETLSSPGFSDLPDQLGDFMQTIGDVSTRLAPLTQLAENAGGLLGAFRLPGLAGSPRPSQSPAGRASARSAPRDAIAEESSGLHVTMKRVPALTPTDRTTAAKKTAAKKTAAKKTAAKKTGAKKTAAKKTGAKKTAAKKTAAKKTGAKRTSAKKTTAKR